jgi:hypothetical protein
MRNLNFRGPDLDGWGEFERSPQKEAELGHAIEIKARRRIGEPTRR